MQTTAIGMKDIFYCLRFFFAMDCFPERFAPYARHKSQIHVTEYVTLILYRCAQRIMSIQLTQDGYYFQATIRAFSLLANLSPAEQL